MNSLPRLISDNSRRRIGRPVGAVPHHACMLAHGGRGPPHTGSPAILLMLAGLGAIALKRRRAT